MLFPTTTAWYAHSSVYTDVVTEVIGVIHIDIGRCFFLIWNFALNRVTLKIQNAAKKNERHTLQKKYHQVLRYTVYYI